MSDVAKALYGAGSDLAERWARQRHDELDEGRVDDLLVALRLHAGTTVEASTCFDYITNNRSRMRYPEFRARELFVGSGVIEAGCKTVIGARLKRSGMFWTVRGANTIIALRCCRLSGRFDNHWESRLRAA